MSRAVRVRPCKSVFVREQFTPLPLAGEGPGVRVLFPLSREGVSAGGRGARGEGLWAGGCP
jgi:hypothetical protein